MMVLMMIEIMAMMIMLTIPNLTISFGKTR